MYRTLISMLDRIFFTKPGSRAAAALAGPRGEHRVLTQAKREFFAAHRQMNARIRANTVSPADLDRVASAHQQYLRVRFRLRLEALSSGD